MHRYIPNTDSQNKKMLACLGLETIEDLFSEIPSNVRLKRKLDIPAGLSEMELVDHMRGMSDANCNISKYPCFLGAGAYDHYIPAMVAHVTSRQEFYTAYTPYQPEISQGTLQAIFEYQTMICELTGMDAANASMYDGASALTEACTMACRVTGKERIVAPVNIHPESRDTLKTVARFSGSVVVETGYKKNGGVDLDELASAMTDDTAAVVIQNPNFFGVIENLQHVIDLAHGKKALVVVSVDPISLALLTPPGEMGADIVVGEGQALGNRLLFGGPYLGFFATTKKWMRKMPGRIVGQTTDKNGKRGYVLTLQAREQHIRRHKATSNICSNQALNALAATAYLTAMGRKGLKKAAELCYNKSHYAFDELMKTGRFSPVFSAPFFKEFTVKSKEKVEGLNKRLLEEQMIGGLAIERFYPELQDTWLVAVTEKRKREEIDRFVTVAGGGGCHENGNATDI